MAKRRNNPDKPSRFSRAGKTGRPPKEIWPEQIRELAKMQHTLTEIAAVIGCNVTTITDDPHLMQCIEIGREQGKSTLRTAQWKKAVTDMSPPLQIWLGKNYLNQSDNPVIDKATAKSAFESWLGKDNSAQDACSDKDKQ